MLNIDNRVVVTERFQLRIKRRFIEGVKNKDFLITLILLLLKSLLFIMLISDDKANGFNFRNMFFSMPPILVWTAVHTTLLSIVLLFNGQVQRWIFWSMNLAITLLIIGDMWYFRSNSVFLNYHMFSMTSNLENLASSIVSMFRLVDLVFVIDLIYLAFRNIKYRKTSHKYSRNLIGAILICLISLVYLQYAHIKVDKKGMGFSNQYVFRTCWAQNQTMSNLTPLGYHVYDYFEFKEQSKPYILDSDEKESVIETLSSLKEHNPDNEYSGVFKGKNLILIQWESLETFVVNQKINGEEITPNLNRLLNNSLYFDNFYEQTYGGTSSDAELITNTSVFPVRDGSTFFRFPGNIYDKSLPNIFERMGYDTLASHPDKGSYWNWLPSLRSIGFNNLLEASNYDTSDRINLGVSDESYLRQFVDKIKELEKPYMAYTITLTSHSPFDIPDDKEELTLPDYLKGTKLGGYYQSIRYTDKYIGELIDRLESEGTLNDTAIVIYGDHEGVHKFYDDEIAKMKGLEEWEKDNNRRIPLVIYNKDIEGKTFSMHGGQVDILPTLAYLFGASKGEYESNLTIGRNLLTTEKDYVMLSIRKLLHNGLSEEEQKKVESLIDISDKLVRGNYFREGAGIDE